MLGIPLDVDGSVAVPGTPTDAAGPVGGDCELSYIYDATQSYMGYSNARRTVNPWDTRRLLGEGRRVTQGWTPIGVFSLKSLHEESPQYHLPAFG